MVSSARYLNTVQTSAEYEQELLVAQRLNRPTSPHLTIYEPQLTWYLSSLHRITGVALAGSFYGLTCGYAAASILGYDIGAQLVVDYFASYPDWFKTSAKLALVYPFFFHLGNGVRHLIWDSGRELTIKGVYRTGYAVLGFTALLGSYYALFV